MTVTPPRRSSSALPEVADSRLADVAGATVRRALPQRRRRTVGAWCFADHFGPSTNGVGSIGPHPHIGLQTVTWLLEGELLHRDSVGSEQPIRPGQLNLMTAGNGVVHAEEAPVATGGPSSSSVTHGVQLWVALPEATRRGAPAFEHHDELPEVELAGATATVLVGALAGERSPARADTDHVGAQLAMRGPAPVPLAAGAEHAILALDGAVTVDGRALDVGQVAYLAPGRDEVALAPVDGAGGRRVLLVGGSPFPDEVHMWWNFVAAGRDEITEAWEAWRDHADRFPTVDSPLARVPAPRPPWVAER
ncbi:MAG TPA: pirin family protein [Aquihabitans sp.]|jgi:hypothetical protein|nr:pirin family protein [Aquihabitans sp.]